MRRVGQSPRRRLGTTARQKSRDGILATALGQLINPVSVHYVSPRLRGERPSPLVDFLGVRCSLVRQVPGEEAPLPGNVTTGVVRIGDTVRRPAMPWSTSVDALLAHFHAVGFDAAPRALGYDEIGRQVFSFVEGFVSPDPADLDASRIAEVGRVIRRMHDASNTFTPGTDAIWNVAIAPDREDLICHHDLAPWNLVRTPTTLTFIDWDGAGPGSRLWDLAYAAHGFVPLSPDTLISDDVASQRLRALVDGYALDHEERVHLADLLGPRIRSMYELLKNGHETGAQPWSRLWSEGHAAGWLADAEYVDRRKRRWEEALGITTGDRD